LDAERRRNRPERLIKTQQLWCRGSKAGAYCGRPARVWTPFTPRTTLRTVLTLTVLLAQSLHIPEQDFGPQPNVQVCSPLRPHFFSQ
jgi:hypothetical protein